MGQLDNLVTTHMSERLFQPNRLVMTLSSLAIRSLSAQAGKSSSEHVKRRGTLAVAAVDHAYGDQGPCSVRAEARGQGVQCRSPGQRLFDRRATVGRRAIRNPNLKGAFALPKAPPTPFIRPNSSMGQSMGSTSLGSEKRLSYWGFDNVWRRGRDSSKYWPNPSISVGGGRQG